MAVDDPKDPVTRSETGSPAVAEAAAPMSESDVRPERLQVRGGARLRGDRTDAIRAAAMNELAEQGYGRFSMSSVASRAGVGKAAIYRRWATKEDLVADLAGQAAVPSSKEQRGDGLADELGILLRSTRDALAGPRTARVVADLLAESLRDPEFGERLRRTVTVGRRQNVSEMLDRAVARGEIAPGIPFDAALDLIAGPLVVHLFTEQGAMDDAYLEQVLRLLLGALTAPS